MKHLITILIFQLIIFSCTKIIENTDSYNYFDIMTWNIEEFPKHTNTNALVTSSILKYNPSIIAFQEIISLFEFENIYNNLENYDGYRSNSAAYELNLAYIWDTTIVKNVQIYEIFADHNYYYPFPRAPLVMECNINNLDFVIINNHFKCCDNGMLRRIEAVTLLKDYMDDNYFNVNIILLGDLNDNLNDSENNNVFNPFLDDRDSYIFVDENFEIDNYSYPSYPSHIDHILISNELFSYFNSEYSETYTIQLDNEIESYFNQVSDHLPVYLKLVFE